MTHEAANLDVDVVVIGPAHLDSFAANIADGFEDLGLTATVIDPFARFAGKGTIRSYTRYGAVMRRLVDQWDPARLALVDRPIAQALDRLAPRIVLSTYGYFAPTQIEAWRRLTPGATWAMWYPDAFVNLGPHRALLAPYDHFFFKDPYIVDLLSRRATLPAHYLAQACNPRHHRPARECEGSAGEADCDVLVAGNLYAYRLLLLEGLSPDIDLRVYGNPRTAIPRRFARLARAHSGYPVFGEEKAKAFGRSRIVLSTMHYGEVAGVNSRLFEATGSGSFVLTHSSDALSRYFQAGVEVATFDTPADMNAAIHHYLGDPAARAAIAAAGSARTQRDHTYAVRLPELIRTCGLARDDRFASAARPR